jgi:hypothetical protein
METHRDHAKPVKNQINRLAGVELLPLDITDPKQIESAVNW